MNESLACRILAPSQCMKVESQALRNISSASCNAARGGDYLRSSHRQATRQINWPQMCCDVLRCCEHGISHLVGADPDIARVRPTDGYYDLLLSRWAKIRHALEQTKLAWQLVQTSCAPG